MSLEVSGKEKFRGSYSYVGELDEVDPSQYVECEDMDGLHPVLPSQRCSWRVILTLRALKP